MNREISWHLMYIVQIFLLIVLLMVYSIYCVNPQRQLQLQEQSWFVDVTESFSWDILIFCSYLCNFQEIKENPTFSLFSLSSSILTFSSNNISFSTGPFSSFLKVVLVKQTCYYSHQVQNWIYSRKLSIHFLPPFGGESIKKYKGKNKSCLVKEI